MSDAVRLAPRQIARLTGDRGRGSRLTPLRFAPVTPFLDQHHKMWIGPDETKAEADGERGHNKWQGFKRAKRGQTDLQQDREQIEHGTVDVRGSRRSKRGPGPRGVVRAMRPGWERRARAVHARHRKDAKRCGSLDVIGPDRR